MNGIVFILIAVLLIIPIAIIREKMYVKAHRQEINMKARFWVLMILRSILLLMVVSVDYFIYKTGYEKERIVTSDKGNYTLAIDQIGVPDFPFGQSYLRLTLSADDRKTDEMDITLKNDGKHPDQENFTIQWLTEGVSVTAHGEEQDDVTYILYFDMDRMNSLNSPQLFNANFIEWVDGGMKVCVCDPLDNTVFPDGAQLTVRFEEVTEFIDLDGSVLAFNPHRKLFEPEVSRKLKWVEGMVLQIKFSEYRNFVAGNGYGNRAVGITIENVDVIAVDGN